MPMKNKITYLIDDLINRHIIDAKNSSIQKVLNALYKTWSWFEKMMLNMIIIPAKRHK